MISSKSNFLEFVVSVLNLRSSETHPLSLLCPSLSPLPSFHSPLWSISVPRWVRWTAPKLEWHKQADQLFRNQSGWKHEEDSKIHRKTTLGTPKGRAGGYYQDGGVWESGLGDDRAAGVSVWRFRGHQPGRWRRGGGTAKQVLYTLDLTSWITSTVAHYLCVKWCPLCW